MQTSGHVHFTAFLRLQVATLHIHSFTNDVPSLPSLCAAADFFWNTIWLIFNTFFQPQHPLYLPSIWFLHLGELHNNCVKNIFIPASKCPPLPEVEHATANQLAGRGLNYGTVIRLEQKIF